MIPSRKTGQYGYTCQVLDNPRWAGFCWWYNRLLPHRGDDDVKVEMYCERLVLGKQRDAVE